MKDLIVAILCGIFIKMGTAMAQSPQMKSVHSDTTDKKKEFIIKQAIVVEADRNNSTAQPHHCTTIESALQSVSSISLIRRGNFALEPMVRGMSGGQVAITVDGMKMHSACVDKMDPITAYIEPENLQQLELSTGSSDVSAAQTQGGSLNLVTVKPKFTDRFSGNGETSFATNSPLVRLRGSVNYSHNNTALRGSFSIRRAGDFSAGNNQKIIRSGFQKENYKLDVLHKLSDVQDISIAYIRDEARNIGYPALVMDATQTQSNILSLDYKIRNISKSIPVVTAKIYWNSVHHLMDDFSRSTMEIENRSIMPGMYMPMDGTTQTTGLISDILFASQVQTLKLTLDVFHLSAFADMNMLPLSNGVPMHLVNLANVENLNSAIAAEWNYEPIVSDFHFRVAARFDYSRRNLNDAEGKSAFTAFWNSENILHSYSIASINAAIEYSISNQTSVGFSAARASRLPTHIENYGFYLFNPLDNAIYMGNPDLEPERGWQGEFGIQNRTSEFQFKGTAFANYIENYIAGKTIIKPDTSNKQFPQAFRRYESIGAVLLKGMEIDCSYFLDNWKFRATYRLQLGNSQSLKESLPWMAPMELTTQIHWENDQTWAEIGSRFAARQTNLSYTIFIEDQTPGFAVFDIRAGLSVGGGVVLLGGIENIFDKYYWEYSSVGNLPSVGRNMYINVGISF